MRRRNQPYDRRFLVETARKARVGGERILPYVCELVHPTSIVDVGCGTGAWLGVAAELGVTDVLGIDGDYVPPDLCEVSLGRFRRCDLSRGFSVDRSFDLAIALEVAEHLPDTSASRFVRSLVDASPVVLFSAAIPGQPGTGHVNLQWPEYWAALFARSGFVGIDCVRPRFWADETIPYFYRQNTVLYVNRHALRTLPRLRAERPRAGDRILPLVHPVLYERDPSLRQTARAIGPAAKLAISRRIQSRPGRSEQHWIRAS
jgi:SAM-dependent methyltransferase